LKPHKFQIALPHTAYCMNMTKTTSARRAKKREERRENDEDKDKKSGDEKEPMFSVPAASVSVSAVMGRTDAKSDSNNSQSTLRIRNGIEECLRIPIPVPVPVQVPSLSKKIIEKQFKNTKKTRSRLTIAEKFDNKNVGLGAAALTFQTAISDPRLPHGPIESHEELVRRQDRDHFLSRMFSTLTAAVMVFFVYLVTLETLMSVTLSIGLTIFWLQKGGTDETWEGSGMDWVILGFAVVTPITVTIQIAFARREKALYEINRIRSLSFQLYVSHNIWDWSKGEGRAKAMSEDEWLQHTDLVLEQLVGIGDELCRFLTLPTSSRSYHRMLKSGRNEAASIVEVAYCLLDSLYTQRIIKISHLTEKVKSMGLGASEVSRLRQYERFMGEAIEQLRMIKMYRTPQALRCFGRIFTLLLPSFYAPAFAQLALDLDSIAMGILAAILTPLLLTALFESMQLLEDPFVGWVSLDGIDVPEELEVLHYHQLINARCTFFPHADPFEEISKAAIVSASQVCLRKSHNGSEVAPMDGSSRMSHFALDATGGGDLVRSSRPNRRQNY